MSDLIGLSEEGDFSPSEESEDETAKVVEENLDLQREIRTLKATNHEALTKINKMTEEISLLLKEREKCEEKVRDQEQTILVLCNKVTAYERESKVNLLPCYCLYWYLIFFYRK